MPAASNLPAGLDHLAPASTTYHIPPYTEYSTFILLSVPTWGKDLAGWLAAVRRGRQEFCLRFAIEHIIQCAATADNGLRQIQREKRNPPISLATLTALPYSQCKARHGRHSCPRVIDNGQKRVYGWVQLADAISCLQGVLLPLPEMSA